MSIESLAKARLRLVTGEQPDSTITLPKAVPASA